MAKNNDMNEGFTMAELLVVVAIIAVLVAIAIPVFSSQLKNARLAVDHSAVRDAYAVVQVANNTHEVVINGQTRTFEQLDRNLESSYMVYFLSEDCSSLVQSSLSAPSSPVFRFQEVGVDSSGVCHTCKQWDNALSPYAPPSKTHLRDWPITIVYDKPTHQLYLGWTS